MQIDKWLAPRTLPELQDALRDKKPTDYFISGGTDLLVAIRGGKAVGGLIDLTHLADLHHIEADDQTLFIGGGMTYDEIAKNDIIRKLCPVLAKAAGMVGSQQVRNRGTVAGGVANASPAGDITPVLTCLQADVNLLDDSGTVSKTPIEDFLLGAGQTKLQANQCILGFELPVNHKQLSAYGKLGSRSQVTIAQMTATIALSLADNEIIECRLVVGSIGVRPIRLTKAEALFVGKKVSDLTAGTFTKAAHIFARYIQETVPKEFDRDYKAVAIIGVFEDLSTEILLK